MWFKKLICFLFATFILASCNQSTSPASTRSGSEIIVVCDKSQWEGMVGDSIRGALMQPMEGFSESEPEFTLIFMPKQNSNKFLLTDCNVLLVDIQAKYKKSSVETLSNVWSHPQQVIKLKASSEAALLNIFSKHREAIRTLFKQNEHARFSAQIALNRNGDAEKILLDELGIQMNVPSEFKLVAKNKDFILLRSELTSKSIGLMIYSYPYKDSAQMNPVAVLDSRDRYSKRYISAGLKGSYMATEREGFKPVSRKILFKNMLAIETRGLWKTVDDSRNGSFLNYSVVDAPRSRIIVFDGYVFSPNKPTRDCILQLESSILSAEFGEKGRREKGEGRSEKGERRREKGERRREN